MKQLFTIAMICLTAQVWAQSGTVTVTIKNFESTTGTVKLALYDSKENYMENHLMSIERKLNGQNEVVLILGGLPAGKYAFSIYHDANGNGDLDKNMMGIPTEDYAFSNNANGRFGPPDYELCEFAIGTNEIQQSINLN